MSPLIDALKNPADTKEKKTKFHFQIKDSCFFFLLAETQETTDQISIFTAVVGIPVIISVISSISAFCLTRGKFQYIILSSFLIRLLNLIYESGHLHILVYSSQKAKATWF